MTGDLKVQDKVSENVLDRRGVATHSLSALIGFLLAMIGVALKPSPSAPNYDLVLVVSTALDHGQEFWSKQIHGWRDARVVLLDSPIATPCGLADHDSGPFYCPRDERIYIELSFLRSIPTDFARAYVVAHELGHHVQKLRSEIDGSSVDVELEADCYAGEWLRVERSLDAVDVAHVRSAVDEARAVGDDRLCPHCSPEEWTHGSADMRANAVTAGITGRGCR